MGKRFAGWGLAVGCAVLAAVPVQADEPATAGLKAEIEVLKERLSSLEAKLDQNQTVPPTSGEGPALVQLPSGLQGVQMSGFVDTTFTYNMNHPQTRANTLRVFDTAANSFMINNAELVVDKPVSAESPMGFKTSLMFGTDAEVVGGVTGGLGAAAGATNANETELQQAYVEYLAPIGNGLDLKAGKFSTLHGAEVIESKDNWNISRSLLFGFAIPFTHTGIRAHYPVSDQLMVMAGVNNAWDVVDDNNQAKTTELGFSSTPIEHTSLGATYMFGAEQAGNNNNGRHLLDIVAGYQPIEALQLKLNYDYGWEDDIVATDNNAVWQGLAAYARYALTDRAALSLRGEFFNDMDGVRTAINTTAINGVTATGIKVYEVTLTGEYQIHKNLIGRLEYRHDRANEKIFRNRDLGQRSYQDTIALEFIAPF